MNLRQLRIRIFFTTQKAGALSRMKSLMLGVAQNFLLTLMFFLFLFLWGVCLELKTRYDQRLRYF